MFILVNTTRVTVNLLVLRMITIVKTSGISDMTGSVLCIRRPIGSIHSSTAIPELHDRKVVRSSALRPVSSFQQSHTTHSIRCSRITNSHVVFWMPFQDWRRYRMILVQGLGMSAADVAATTLSFISRGSREQAWDSAEAVLACANISGKLLSSLPREVVFHIIAPRILFATSEV